MAGVIEIPRRQLNPRRCCRCGNPERYRRRIALLPPGICRPDCQPVVSQRQLREAVCGFRPAVLLNHARCHASAATVRASSAPFTTFGVSQSASTWYSPLSAVTSAVRCCTAGGVTPFTVPLWSPSKCAPLSTMASFSGTCCTAVFGVYVVLTDTHAAEQALAQRRQLQPPHAVSGNAVRNTAHFYLHAVGDGLDLHADRIATSVNQAYQRGTGGWQRDFTVERQRPGLAVYRQHAPIDRNAGIVIITDFNAGAEATAPLKSTVCVSSSSVLISHSPARCAFAWYSQRHPSSWRSRPATGNGYHPHKLCVSHAVVGLISFTFNGIMAVLRALSWRNGAPSSGITTLLRFIGPHLI